MKAELRADGTLYIIAETVIEAYALKYIYNIGNEQVCNSCGTIIPVAEPVIDLSILNGERI